MPTPTTNYSFNLPVEGADDDVWGGLLNDNWIALDAQLFSGTIGADTTGNAATATLATDATTLATPRGFTIGATTRNFDGSADVAWSLGDIGIVLADQAEAQAGTDSAKFMTPLRTAEAIAALTPPVAQLTQLQAEDPASTVFGTVSGQRLAQHTDDAFNVTGDAPKFACRAWVNFDGAGTVAIRASGNVSSITDNGVGRFTVNFTTAMPDADYATTFGAEIVGTGGTANIFGYIDRNADTYTASSASIRFSNSGASSIDPRRACIAVFR